MKLTLLLVILACVNVNAKIFAQNLSLNAKGKGIKAVLLEIKKKTGYDFLYNDSALKDAKPVTVHLKNASLKEVLDACFDGQPFHYDIDESTVLISRNKTKEASPMVDLQQRSLLGTVRDQQGQALGGVTVLAEGAQDQVTMTDNEGRFRLNVGTEVKAIIFSSVGYKSLRHSIQTSSEINIQLESAVSGLDEVVVVGYGTRTKTDLTGAIDQVRAEDIQRVKANTLAESLVGQVPNLNINIPDGKPGRGASFNIRGTTSINGGGPLVLLDGVTISSYELNNISPQDIDNISFLKDASAAAIYGARAAYGVILIQTKKGGKDGTKLNYNNYFGFNKATRVPDVYDGLDYLSIQENEFNKNIGQTYFTEDQVNYPYEAQKDPSLPSAVLKNIAGRNVLLLDGTVYNYYEKWLREYSPSQNHHLSLSTGKENFKSYLSGDYNRQEGNLTFKPDKINRYNVRFNAEYDINDYITVFSRNSLMIRDDNVPNTYVSPFSSNFTRFINNTNALIPESVEIDGQPMLTDIGWYRQFITNQSDDHTKAQSSIHSLGTDINLFDNTLKLHGDASYIKYNWSRLRWWDITGPYLLNAFNNTNSIQPVWSDWGMEPDQVYRSNTQQETYNVNLYANYKKDINGEHFFDITGGMTFEKFNNVYMTASHQDPLLGLGNHSLNLATGAYTAGDDDDKYANRSLFVRGSYNYKQRYIIDLNGMNNLTSKFARGQRDGYFGSVSGAWLISRESFFEPINSVVSNLKLRASYGALGNQSIGSFDHLSIINANLSSFMLEGNRYVYFSSPQPISENFTWETAKTVDIGMDVGLLNEKLQLTFDVYQRNTDRMLAPASPLPSTYGATVPKENSASLRNRGWEFSLKWNDKIGESSPLNYSITFNIADYQAEITEYNNPSNYLGGYYVGQKLGEIWGLNTLGFFQTDEEAQSSPLLATSAFKQFASAGTIKFEDVNGDGVVNKGDWTLDNHGDYSVIGNSTPRYQYGFSVYLNYKGFDLNALFKGVGKRDIYPNPETNDFWGPYSRKYQVMVREVVENRWTPENPNAYFPKPQGYIALGENDLGVPQTRYLQDASYLRLKNLNIGYNIPSRFFKKATNIRIYMSGSNLFEFTNLWKTLDPEGLELDPDANQGFVGMGTAYPIQRSYVFGIELSL